MKNTHKCSKYKNYTEIFSEKSIYHGAILAKSCQEGKGSGQRALKGSGSGHKYKFLNNQFVTFSDK